MKKNELKDLQTKTPAQLSGFIGKKRTELKKLRGEMAITKHKNVKLAKNLRRDVAQVLTILAQKEGEK